MGCNVSWRSITYKMLVFMYFAFLAMELYYIYFLHCLLVFFMVDVWAMECMKWLPETFFILLGSFTVVSIRVTDGHSR